MDPTRPESFTHKWSLLATGRRYHYVDEIPYDYDPQQDLTILCIHGFPDLWWVFLLLCGFLIPSVILSPQTKVLSPYVQGWLETSNWTLGPSRVSGCGTRYARLRGIR